MQTNDQILWSIAKKRACFKKSLFSYLLICGFLWALWLITGRPANDAIMPWPAWITFWWGVGIVWQYANAYLVYSKANIQSEYEKLKRQS